MPVALKGDFAYFTPEEIMYLLSRFRKTGRLDMGDGNVFFNEGNVVHAKTSEVEGLDAFYYLAMKTGGEFTFYPDEKSPKNTINEALSDLFLEIERRKAEMEEVLKVLPPLNTVPSKSSKMPNKEKIAMKKTHWKILILVDGKRTLKEIIDSCGFEKSEAMRAILWLFNEGLIFDPKEKERILQEGVKKINTFLKEFGEGPWVEIIKKKLEDSKLKDLATVAGTDFILTNKEVNVSTEELKVWFKETLEELRNKAEEILGKIIVTKKWKVVDGAK